MDVEYLGILGSFLLGCCAAPEAIHSYMKGKNTSSLWFLLMWYIGEICVLAYVIPKKDIPLIFNYGLNILFITVIIKYRLFPRKEAENEQ